MCNAMNSGDRAGSVIAGFVSAAAVAIVFMVSSCSVSETHINQPADMLKIRAEHSVKMACIQAKGEYTEYNRCTFKK